MIDERKQMIDEIEGCLSRRDFESAVELCETYTEQRPNDLKIWWLYILADCGACDKKELAALNLNLQQNRVFIEAVSALNEEKRDRLYSAIKSVNKTKKEVGSYDRRDCISFFAENIKSVKAETDELREKIDDALEENDKQFSILRKQGGQVYGNNIFGFIMLTLVVLLPFAILSAFLKLLGTSFIISIIPLIVGLVFVLIRLIIRLFRHKRFIKDLSTINEDVADSEKRLLEYNEVYKIKNSAKKKMMKIYKRIKNDVAASGKRVEKYRVAFEKILRDCNKATVE